MRSMRSVQRQVELRRFGNQLSVLGKVHSLIKMVKCCVLCCCDLEPGITISRVIVARTKSVYRLDDVL